MTTGGPLPVEILHRDARRRLEQAGLPSPELDAALLLEHATGITVLIRMTEPGRLVPKEKVAAFDAFIERRLAREPVHRIIGSREFYGLPLKLNEATLVPRPDTETLVDLVMQFAKDRAARTGRCRILDIGTGSGAIALALIANIDRATATGTDISDRALAAARENAEILGLSERFTAVRSDFFGQIGGSFDLIVSNPPYIRTEDIRSLDSDVRDHDPVAALDGGVSGLDAYRVIASEAAAFLETDGALAVEIGHDQLRDVTALFEGEGFRIQGSRKDYSGKDRTIFFVK